MQRSLSDYIKGKGGAGGSGIKGDWNCTPVVGAGFTAVDTYRAAYDPETKTVSADWTGVPFNAMTPVFGAIRTDMTLGNIDIDEVKKLSIKLTNDIIATPGYGVYFGVSFVDADGPMGGSAQAFTAALFDAFFGGGNPSAPAINFMAVGQGSSPGMVGINRQIIAVTDSAPSGTVIQNSLTQGTPYDYDWSQLNAGDIVTYFLTKKQVNEGNTGIYAAQAVFDSTGDTIAVSRIQSLVDNPVLPPTMTMYIWFMTMAPSGAYPPVTGIVDIPAGPNQVTLSEIEISSGGGFGPGDDFGSGMGGLVFSQEDWDMVFAQPAAGLIPINQATFPQGTKVNDQYRVVLNPGTTTGKPYNTTVTNQAMVTVDNVTPGQEAFRVNVFSDLLEERLTALDPAQLTPLITEAGKRAGYQTFYVKGPNNSSLGDPLSGPGVYDTFEQAYLAAIAQPTYLPKVIIQDDRQGAGNGIRGISIYPLQATDPTYYLAGNNISLSTVKAWHRDIVDGSINTQTDYDQAVFLFAKFDGLRLLGGHWMLANGGGNPGDTSPFVTSGGPSGFAGNPSTGNQRGLEIGDYTKVEFCSMSFPFPYWGGDFIVGDYCSVVIWPDVSLSSPASGDANYYWGYNIAQYDGFSDVPGNIRSLNGELTIKAGLDFYFHVMPGISNLGADAMTFKVQTPARFRNVNFGDLETCQHIIEGSNTDAITAAVNPLKGLAIGSDNKPVIEITTKEELFAQASSMPDGGGSTIYTVNNANNVYLINGNITLAADEILSVANGVRFIGLGRDASILNGMRPGGWLDIGVGGENTFENMFMGVLGGSYPFFRDNAVQGAQLRFKGCYFKYDLNIGNNYIPEGTDSEIVYEKCVTVLSTETVSITVPALVANSVLFDNHRFDDITYDPTSNSYPVFDFSTTTIQGIGRVTFKECDVNTTRNLSIGAKRKLLGVTGFGTSVTIMERGGLVVDNCRKNWFNITNQANDTIVHGKWRGVNNFIFNDTEANQTGLGAKKIIDVYHIDDWAADFLDNYFYTLRPNTIYRIHGAVVLDTNAYYLMPGTEIVGATGLGTDSIQFGASATPAFATGHLLATGDDWVVRDVKLINMNTGDNRYGILSKPNDGFNSGALQPAKYWNEKPVVVDNVEFEFYYNAGTHDAILFTGASGVTEPSFEIGNIVVNASTHNLKVDQTTDNAIMNMTIRGIKKGPLGGTKRRPFIYFTDKKWTGVLTIRDNELIDPPVSISATGVGLLSTSTHRVVAFNNRGVDANGVYGAGAVTTYVDGILMSDTTLMLAEGNIFGAPNSP